MQCADLVAGRVSQIREIELDRTIIPNAGRILACGTAIGDTGSMPGVSRFRTLCQKAYSAAIGMGGGFTIDGLGNGEHACVSAVKASTAIVHDAWPMPESAKYRIVEAPGCVNVIGADHDMTEQFAFLQNKMKKLKTTCWRKIHQVPS